MTFPATSQDSGDHGSIKVAVRLRPLNDKEIGGDGSDPRAWCVSHGKKRSISQSGVAGKVLGQTFFSFEAVFDEQTTTQEVYNEIGKDIVDGVARGLNGTIFAYGQTGSGKTYTMQGPGLRNFGDRGNCGIIQMIAQDVFRHIEMQSDREFLIRTAYMEIYNETVRDLLRSNVKGSDEGSGRRSSLTIRESSKHGGVYVNCHEIVVTDMESLMETLCSGEKNRVVASTAMNERSSRSHSIFRITLESREKMVGGDRDVQDGEDSDDRAVLISTLNLVDLAGSESVRHTGATGQRQREGGKINQSLLTLSQVIHSLSLRDKKPSHINYRNSKLTRILQPSLSGNARMAVLCCATASNLYIEETRSTLKFAMRASLVETMAKKNEVMDDRALIRRLQRELAGARRALKAMEESKNVGTKELLGSTEQLGTDGHNQSPSDAREKLARLKSMILRGGLVLHKAQGTRGRHASEREFLSSSLCRSKSTPRHWRSSVCVAHLYDDDLDLLIYDEDESELKDFFSPPSKNLSPRCTVDDDKTEANRSPDQLRVSEVNILREALAVKGNQARVLQVQLNDTEDRMQSLESELETAKREMENLLKERRSAQQRIDELVEENLSLTEITEVSAEKVEVSLSSPQGVVQPVPPAAKMSKDPRMPSPTNGYVQSLPVDEKSTEKLRRPPSSLGGIDQPCPPADKNARRQETPIASPKEKVLALLPDETENTHNPEKPVRQSDETTMMHPLPEQQMRRLVFGLLVGGGSSFGGLYWPSSRQWLNGLIANDEPLPGPNHESLPH